MNNLILLNHRCLWGFSIRGFHGSPLLVNLRLDEVMNLSRIVMPKSNNLRNNVPMNQQNLDNPQTLAPTNKNDSMVYPSTKDDLCQV